MLLIINKLPLHSY